MGERLTVSIGDQEIDAIKVGIDHVVDSVAAGTADTDYGDTRPQFLHGLGNGQIDGHEFLPWVVVDHVAACNLNALGMAAVGCGAWRAPPLKFFGEIIKQGRM